MAKQDPIRETVKLRLQIMEKLSDNILKEREGGIVDPPQLHNFVVVVNNYSKDALQELSLQESHRHHENMSMKDLLNKVAKNTLSKWKELVRNGDMNRRLSEEEFKNGMKQAVMGQVFNARQLQRTVDSFMRHADLALDIIDSHTWLKTPRTEESNG